MNCDEHTESDACPPLKRDRIRYFTGRHMTARDFSDADGYHRSFRHLHNRMLHGWGVVCGLNVEPHPRPECRTGRVVVRCGLAIDCCGREIVVAHDLVTDPIDWDARPPNAGEHVLILALTYCETLIEKVPVLYSPDACSTPSMDHGRVREGYALSWRWVPRDRLSDWGWVAPGCEPDDGKTPDPDDCLPETPGCKPEDEGCCLDYKCPKGHIVPLAVIDAKGPEDFGTTGRVDLKGRRSVGQAAQHLTHICGINWPHGGFMKVSELTQLEVRFDRALLPAEHPKWPGPRGINERTFVVQYGEQLDHRLTEDLDFVEFEEIPALSADGRTAIYKIRKPASYCNHVVHITLRCDFILDCRRQPVDGDFLAADLPTGNGIAGGTFESWFRVVDDYEYDRLMKDADTAGPKESQS